MSIRSVVAACATGFRWFVTGTVWRWPVFLSILVTSVHLMNRPGLAPRRWEELAVSWGLRLPVDALSGLWHLLLAGLDVALPPDALVVLLRLAGAIAAGLIVLLCDRLFDWSLPSVLRERFQSAPNGSLWKHLLTGGASLLFVCSDPVWNCCQSPGADLGHIFGMLSAAVLLVWLLRRGRYYALPLVTLLLGLLTGDGLFAVFVFAGVIIYLGLRSRCKDEEDVDALVNPIVLRAVTARAICGYLVGVAVACVANVWVYRHLGGVLRMKAEVGDVLLAIVGDALASVVPIWTPAAGIFVLVVIVLPLVIARLAIPRLWPKQGESSPLILLPVAIATAVAFSQLTGFGPLEFCVPILRRARDFTVAVWTFSALMAIVWGGACLVARGQELVDARWRRGVLTAVGFAVVVMYGSVAYERFRPHEARMQDLVEIYCHEVAKECAADERLVTDGSLDAGVELSAWRKGRRLYAVSTVSGYEPHAVKTRQRGVTDGEDRDVLASGAAGALREWLEIRTNRLATVAAQTGFNLWHAFGETAQPRFSGLVVHFGGTEGRLELESRERARMLGRRIVGTCRRGIPTRRTDPALLQTFYCVQWRVAQACRQRQGNTRASVNELSADSKLADELDRLNPQLEVIRQQYGWMAEQCGAIILPREGLKTALKKKNFSQAGYYAEQVLTLAPEDAEAHFALGMNHYLNRQYARAIHHLTLVLKVQGENPGVLNNLAMAYLRLGRPMEAVAAAERAVQVSRDDVRVRKSAEYVFKHAREQLGGAGK